MHRPIPSGILFREVPAALAAFCSARSSPERKGQRNPSYPSVYVLKRYLNFLEPVKSSIYASNFGVRETAF
jgi:hypothetical protein